MKAQKLKLSLNVGTLKAECSAFQCRL